MHFSITATWITPLTNMGTARMFRESWLEMEQPAGRRAGAKIVLATGAAQNNRVDFIIYADGQDAMGDFSSRGPCAEGRIKPDVVAPGTWISSLQSSTATDENAWLGISPNYQY